jgi:hypothetical protein
MATNAATREAATGVIEGVRIPLLLTTPPLPPRMKSLDLVAHIVAGAILQPINPLEVVQGLASDQTPLVAAITKQGAATARTANVLMNVGSPIGGKGPAELFLQQRDESGRAASLMVYKARPLDGIWATAPTSITALCRTSTSSCCPRLSAPRRSRSEAGSSTP